MASLAEKFKHLGISTGKQEIEIPKKKNTYTIESTIEGFNKETDAGFIYIIETRYPLDHTHGRYGMRVTTPLETLSHWVRREEILEFSFPSLVFIDIETTGLSGGTGTYAFLIGAGRFDEDGFQILQFFLRDPLEEPSQLLALEEFIAPCQAVVTFNGKAFDIPLLRTRYIFQGWKPPLDEFTHIDLLHLARRLWRDRIPSRTLPNLEARILGILRSEEDIPGWMVPTIYFNYLRDGDARPLRQVLYHNRMDVLSLAALLNYMAGLLNEPMVAGNQFGTDLFALGRLFEDLGDIDSAINLYTHGLEHEDVKKLQIPETAFIDAINRLANIHKRQGDFHEAVALWEQAADHKSFEARIELAKYYEHRCKNYPLAIEWTRSALNLLLPDVINGENWFEDNPQKHNYLLNELQHRLNRLILKQSRCIDE